MKIDFVLPWVDGNDKNWREQKNKFNQNKDLDANSEARFRDLETLKYVLRSIETFCPWYNKIYLITCGHYPSWLNIDHPKIKLISHQELYYNKDDLPVFNSSSIEMNLPNIPELSEHFVYLNDDFLILQPVEQERFFKNNLPIDFISHGWLKRGKLFNTLRPLDSWEHSLNNIIKLINKFNKPNQLAKEYLYHNSYSMLDKISNFLLKNIYRKYFWFEHWHLHQPYNKSTLLEVNKLFHKEMMECSRNKFRAKNDLTQYLYRYWHLTTGTFFPTKFNDGLVCNIQNLNNLIEATKIIDQKNIKFVCLNDVPQLKEDEFLAIKEFLINYLNHKLPTKASFEV